MSAYYVMPSLGSGMTSGRVIEWHVTPGQRVRRGDVIGLVDTDKGAIEIEVWEDAVILEILAPPGTKADVGAPLLALGPPDGEAVAPAPPATRPEPGRRVRVTPVARKRAAAAGIDPETLTGTGAAGAVTLADVEAAVGSGVTKGSEPPAAPPPPAPSMEQEVEAPDVDRNAPMRRAIAAAMTRSKREIPHYYLATTVPVERALRWIEEANRDRSPADRRLPAALYLKATATALGEYPELNGFWEHDAFRPGSGIHIGVAISLRGGGLVAPALHDVPDRSVDDLSKAVRDLVQRARAARLRGSEVTDATVTVTSLGDRGVETVFGVIYPPQVALIGVGKAVERPWAESGMIGVRRVVHLTLAADHRASDGHRGGLFLERVADLLQRPEEL